MRNTNVYWTELNDMKAWKSNRPMWLNCRNRKKPDAQTLETCNSRPGQVWWDDGQAKQPVFSELIFSRLADIHSWPMSVMQTAVLYSRVAVNPLTPTVAIRVSRLHWTWRGEFLNLAYPRPILSKTYSILFLLTYYEPKLVPLQSGYDVTHLSLR